MIARVENGQRLVACDYCPERRLFARGAVRNGMGHLSANGWRLRKSDTACPSCVEQQNTRDLTADLLASHASLNGLYPEMSVTTGEEDAA